MKKPSLLGRLLDKLQWRPLQVFLRHYRSAEMDISSIAVAYYLMLTAFPLIIIAANVFPYLNLDLSDMLSFAEHHLPKSLYLMVDSVITNIFSKPSSSMLSLATLTAFWTMTKSLTSLQKAVNKAYGEADHRDFLISHFIGVMLSFLILFLLTFVLLLTTFLKTGLQVIGQFYGLSPHQAQLVLDLAHPLTTLIIFTGVAILYFTLPNVKIKKLRFILPGSILTTLTLTLFSNVFGAYVLDTFTRMIDIKTFGSVVIFIIMLWFVFVASILIFGGILNATYQELSSGSLESRRGDVIQIIQERRENRE